MVVNKVKRGTFSAMGIDMSLRAAGFVAVSSKFAAPVEGGTIYRVVMTETFGLSLQHKATMGDQIARLVELRRAAVEFYLNAGSPTNVVIEEYAFAATDSYAHAIGEAGGVVKVALADEGARISSVVVSSARKLLLGVGNLPSKKAKLAVREAFEAVGYVGMSEAEYDALCVANWKLGELGLPCFASPPVERKRRR